MNEQPRKLSELLSRLRQVRFSLGTCVFLILFLGSVIAAWVNRHPWVMVKSVPLPNYHVNESLPHVHPLREVGKVLVHRPHTKERLAVLDWHAGQLETVEFARDEVLLEASSGSGRFLTFDKQGAARVRQIRLEYPLAELPRWFHPTVQNARISPDGNRIAASGPDCAIWIYDLSTQEETTIPARSESSNRVHLEFSEDGEWLQALERKRGVSSLEFTGLQVINCKSAKPVKIPEEVMEHMRGVQLCTFNNTNDRICMDLCNWKVGSTELEGSPGLPLRQSSQLRSGLVGFRGFAEVFEIWTSDLKKRLGHVEPTGPPVWGLYLSPSGTQMAYEQLVGDQSRAILWNTVSGKRIYAFPVGLQVCRFLGENHILGFDWEKGELQVWWRRRSESAWGVFGQPEVWLALVFLIAFAFSIRRDRRAAKVPVAS